MDILLNRDRSSPKFGDAVFKNGPLTKSDVTQPFVQNVSQRLYLRLTCFEGEWFLQDDYGVPYFQRVLGLKPTKSAVDQILQQEILEERGVKEITFFQSSLLNRVYSATFRVKCVDGSETDLININPVN